MFYYLLTPLSFFDFTRRISSEGKSDNHTGTMEGFAGSQLLIQPEAEAMAKDIEPFPLCEVGTRRWQVQRTRMERLNCQAHYNTSQNGGKGQDFVVEALLSHNKVSVLIHELLVMEQWRRRVFPLIRDDLMQANPTCLYNFQYYEGVLANLLELVFWHEEGITRADDDLLEVLDYLWRNITMLNAHADDDYWPGTPSYDASAPAKDAAAEKAWLEGHRHDSERRQLFTVCMTSVSLLWYIIDKMKVLPMSAVNNILKKNDMPVGLCCLMDARPWLRKGPNGMEKFKTKEWKDVKGAEVMVVCEYEAHAWFCLHTLLTEQGCREKYSYTLWRKEQILRARKFLNDVLVDQIPPLQEVQRALDELSFLDPPVSVDEKFKSSLVIEPCSRIMDGILHRIDCEALAAEAKARLTDPANVRAQASEMSALIDQMLGMDLGDLGGGGDEGVGAAGNQPSEAQIAALIEEMKAQRKS